jgi:hypothetical protein
LRALCIGLCNELTVPIIRPRKVQPTGDGLAT